MYAPVIMMQMKKSVLFSFGFMFFALLWMLVRYIGSGGINWFEAVGVGFLFCYGLVWLLMSLDFLPQNVISEVNEERLTYKPDFISPKVNLKIGNIRGCTFDLDNKKIRVKIRKGGTLLLDYRKLGQDEMEKWVLDTKS